MARAISRAVAACWVAAWAISETPACVVATRSRIVWKLSALAVTSRTPLPTSAPTPRTVATARAISVATSSTMEAIWPAAALVRLERSRISPATTAKPAPCWPAWAASTAALRARRLVALATSRMTATTVAMRSWVSSSFCIRRAASSSDATICWMAAFASRAWRTPCSAEAAVSSAEREAPVTCRTTSATDDDSSSAAAATSAPRLAWRWASPSMEPARSESAYEVDVSSGTAWRADSRLRRRAPIDRAHRKAVTVPAAPAPARAATATDGRSESQRAIERSRAAAQTAALAPASPRSGPRRSRAGRTTGPGATLGGGCVLGSSVAFTPGPLCGRQDSSRGTPSITFSEELKTR